MGYSVCFANIILTALITVSTADYVSKTYSGTEKPQSYAQHLPADDYFNPIKLVCSATHVIHISYLELLGVNHNKLSTNAVACSMTKVLRKRCEGIPGTCVLYVSNGSCKVNQLNMTLMCVPDSKIYSMCPIYPSIRFITSGQTEYFTTPKFTSTSNLDFGYKSCQCDVSPVTGGSITIRLLYVDLTTNDQCSHYISLNSGKKFCQVNQGDQESPISKNFIENETASIKVVSSGLGDYRGAWFSVSPGAPYGTIRISCADDANPIRPSTIGNEDTTVSSNDGGTSSLFTGQIVGIVVGVIASVVIVLVVACVLIKVRHSKRRRSVRRQQSQLSTTYHQVEPPASNHEQPTSPINNHRTEPSAPPEEPQHTNDAPPSYNDVISSQGNAFVTLHTQNQRV